jgi:hypothetical protein
MNFKCHKKVLSKSPKINEDMEYGDVVYRGAMPLGVQANAAA